MPALNSVCKQFSELSSHVHAKHRYWYLVFERTIFYIPLLSPKIYWNVNIYIFLYSIVMHYKNLHNNASS